MRLKNEYYDPIEAIINALFAKIIYIPLGAALKELEAGELQNANDPVVEAIRRGRVYEEGGVFKGTFNAAISKQFKKLGARYSNLKKGWVFSAVPAPIQMVIAAVQDRYKKILNALLITIDEMKIEPTVAKSPLASAYDGVIGAMNNDFERTVQGITIAPKLTAAMRQIIAHDWAKNLELYIVDWAAKNILELRQKVQQNVMQGYRADSLVKMIQTNYQVSKTKAKFLARQETSLLMSKIREERYKSIGSDQYKWSGAMDERERPDHKALQGKVFSWGSPPITNRETGARNNPGEDFGCRCVAIPIVKGYNDGKR